MAAIAAAEAATSATETRNLRVFGTIQTLDRGYMRHHHHDLLLWDETEWQLAGQIGANGYVMALWIIHTNVVNGESNGLGETPTPPRPQMRRIANVRGLADCKRDMRLQWTEGKIRILSIAPVYALSARNVEEDAAANEAAIRVMDPSESETDTDTASEIAPEEDHAAASDNDKGTQTEDAVDDLAEDKPVITDTAVDADVEDGPADDLNRFFPMPGHFALMYNGFS
ncbi:uncharacterized protein K452DRAFT_296921 [Aplosporella prunicola CBS 121167]|uniref:Uncharacterized protein n=1 Tax=Aplosporella prunicola CBS 121167 TaxID=1176127 RepID=A0A6A6BKN0_9PEZI|nr:uncharacterized protein K452DRAFT_296921 [Aplosporella prunicola CBS 121167]KAF2143131.1 hypothetical protein K452DRAFT_296921 [Aplosporella prunicola CBS 121167]